MVRIIKRSKAGKTLIVDVEVVNDRIAGVVFSGDYFAYPEELVEELEEALRGKTLGEALEVIDSYKDRLRLLGITLEDVKNALREALEGIRRS